MSLEAGHHPVKTSNAGGETKSSINISMDLQFVFPKASTKVDYANDSYIKTLQLNAN